MSVVELEIFKNWFTGTTVIEADWDRIRNPLVEWANFTNRNLEQLARDAHGLSYSLDNDGAPNIPKSLQQQIDEIIAGAAPLVGTTLPIWKIHLGSPGQAWISSAGLSGARTFTFPDANQFILGATAVQDVSGKTFTDNIEWKSGTAFTGVLDHTNTANRTYTYPDASGNVPALPTAATTETGTDAIVRANSPTITTPIILGALDIAGNIKWKSGTAFYGELDHANTADRVYTYPDATGNIPILPNPATTETGTGAIVRATSPTIAAPIITGDIDVSGNVKWKSGTAFYGELDHANTADRVYTYPDVAGNVPSLPTAATTETGTDNIVRTNSPTITSPTINTSISGTAFLDDDTFATATATTVASSESIKAYVDTAVAAGTTTLVTQTGPLTYTLGAILYGPTPHGFGRWPDAVQIYMKCISAEGNYSAGDVIMWSMDQNAVRGWSILVDNTNITIRSGSNNAEIPDKNTGVSVLVTPAKWQIYFRFYKFNI